MAAADEARRLAQDLIIKPDAIAAIVRDKDGSYYVHTTAGSAVAVITITVLLSVVAHGVTAGPLATRYARMLGRPPDRRADGEIRDIPERRLIRRTNSDAHNTSGAGTAGRAGSGKKECVAQRRGYGEHRPQYLATRDHVGTGEVTLLGVRNRWCLASRLSTVSHVGNGIAPRDPRRHPP